MLTEWGELVEFQRPTPYATLNARCVGRALRPEEMVAGLTVDHREFRALAADFPTWKPEKGYRVRWQGRTLTIYSVDAITHRVSGVTILYRILAS